MNNRHVAKCPAGHEAVDPILLEAISALEYHFAADLGSITVEQLIIGVFFTGIRLNNGWCGVAYTPPELVRQAGRHIIRGTTPLVRGVSVGQIFEATFCHPFAQIIRIATLNALSAPLFEQKRCPHQPDADLAAMTALFRGRKVCMVGAIIPLLRRLRQMTLNRTGPIEVTIIDRKRATQEEAQKAYGVFLLPEQTGAALARCETAIFTGAALANGSMQALINQVPATAAIAVVGPTAGFIPEPLFRRGVAMIGTAVVTDSDRALALLAEGGGGIRLFDGCIRKINLLNHQRLQQLGLEPDTTP